MSLSSMPEFPSSMVDAFSIDEGISFIVTKNPGIGAEKDATATAH